jgi:hypothetical protein
MNAVFTIVAKNYFSLARSLADSIRKQHGSDIDIIIGIADEMEDETSFRGDSYKIIAGNSIGIGAYQSMAFKYNVTEFCTSIKPFFFDYLFKTGKYEKIIYFDPDILVYHSLDGIFDSLDAHSVVLTPHYVTPQIEYTGNAPETLTLFAGIYNLGFLALKSSPTTVKLLDWWKHRLEHMCYADKFDALHVDQKWMDFIPAFFPKETLVEHHLGLNIAFWNVHERRFIKRHNNYFVVNRLNEGEEYPVVFIHYSGVDPKNIYANKQSARIDLSKYPDWLPLVEDYSRNVMDFEFEKYLNLPYDYAKFSNGEVIIQFHRRLYRRMLEQHLAKGNPFDVDTIFYGLLKKNGLLFKPKNNLDKLNERNFPDFDGKVKKLNKLSKYVKKLLGIERYVLLLKFCQRYFRPENQLFLIEEFEKEYKFLNENI